jgi:hypothetical protein
VRSQLLTRLVRLPGWSLIAATVGVAVLASTLDLVPVRSQTVSLVSAAAEVPPPVDDPWDSIWDAAPSRTVTLSAQEIVPPFGGGTIASLTARALHDRERLYLLLEWSDSEPDDAVNGSAAFSDAIAVQFPSASASGVPPFTMGGPNATVNIWQWKAVWQSDIDSGFATLQDRYPNTFVDFYPGADDPLFRTAEYVGNPLAQRTRETPIENLIAGGFGTLTHSDAQTIDGSGSWADGRWRAIFTRELRAADPDQAEFKTGGSTQLAFAVWDGGSDDRNGQKSIAPFIELLLGETALGDGDGFGGAQILIIVVIALSLAAAVSIIAIAQRRVVP